jgi:hypothetical protein
MNIIIQRCFIIVCALLSLRGLDTCEFSCIPEQPHTVDTYVRAGQQLREHFRAAQPFPYAVVDDFFPEDMLRAVLGAFPVYSGGFNGSTADGFTVSAVHSQFLKLEQRTPTTHPTARFLIDHLKSFEFLTFLTMVTGIENLVPDPFYYGAGLHHTLRGGYLGVHLDYNFNPYLQMWRRVNVFVYLNEGWNPEWKGDLQFWNADQSELLLSIAPLFNRLVIFEASEHTWHGHPDPLQCPQDVARKSIAMYYYTVDDNPDWQREPRSTLFMPRRNIDTWLPEQRYDPAER